jgi:hypothetical protein
MNKYEMQREARQKEVIKQVLLGMAESGELRELLEKARQKNKIRVPV